MILSAEKPWKNDLCLIKIDSNGDLEWKKMFGKPLYCEGGSCIRETDDRGYIIVGTRQLLPIYGGIAPPAPLSNEVWLIKTDKMGKTMDLRSTLWNFN